MRVLHVGGPPSLNAPTFFRSPTDLSPYFFAFAFVTASASVSKNGVGESAAMPCAASSCLASLNVAAVTVVATAPVAAVAGGGGLGDIIVNEASYRLSGVLAASFCVMALSTAVFLALLGLQIAVTPGGLRNTRLTETLSSGKEQL